jgi:hypothetical protein
LLERLFSAEEKQTHEKPDVVQVSPFSKMSLVLFDKLSIRPLEKVEKQPLLTFMAKEKLPFVRAAKLVIILLYQLENVFRTNVYFMKNLPSNDQNAPSERMVIFALKRYFGINYGKINEMVMRRLIVNREYLLVWSLLLGNFKVKTIFDNILKCGMNTQ